jgi:uncharacterized membrane protein
VSDPRDVARWPVLVFLLVTFLWPAAVLWAPSAAVSPTRSAVSLRVAAGVYMLGSALCHQRADRSFHVGGAQLPVCARCTGIYLGAPVGVAAVLAFSRRRSFSVQYRGWRWGVIAGVLPTVVTVLWEWWTGHVVTGTLRAAAGAPLGMVAAAFVAVALGREVKVD